MKRAWLSITLASAILFSCSSDKTNTDGKTSEQKELPPSLIGQQQGIEMVQLSEKEQNELKIQTLTISQDLVEYSVMAPGVVFPAPGHSSMVSTPINGQISRIYKFEGDRVRSGDMLFQIQSIDFGNMVSEYLQAYAEERFQRNRLNRMKQLVEETISSASELERASSEFERASAILRANYSRLRALGVADDEIRQFAEGENINPMLHIHSPINGIVESNFVELGQSVNALENLSRLLDISKVLVRGYVSPDDARLISPGDSVFITQRDQNSRIDATITSINPGMDENNRSVIANIVVSTVNGWPKPGENLRLYINTSTRQAKISVPAEAITYDGNQAIVFVDRGNGIFEKRPIVISEIRDKNILVENGLHDGDKIAISQVFSLKALLRFHLISEE